VSDKPVQSDLCPGTDDELHHQPPTVTAAKMASKVVAKAAGGVTEISKVSDSPLTHHDASTAPRLQAGEPSPPTAPC
jgi:hypothetical protein